MNIIEDEALLEWFGNNCAWEESVACKYTGQYWVAKSDMVEVNGTRIRANKRARLNKVDRDGKKERKLKMHVLCRSIPGRACVSGRATARAREREKVKGEEKVRGWEKGEQKVQMNKECNNILHLGNEYVTKQRYFSIFAEICR